MGKRILVVDDDPGIQETLEAMLEFEGYETVIAGDGRAALDQIAAMPPALIVLDLMMPGLSGSELVADLQRRGLRPGIPILVLTADPHAQQRAAQLGAEGYLEKPFTMPEFLAEVTRLIGV